MGRFILRRLLYNIPTLFFISLFVFMLVRVLPEGAAVDETGASHPMLSDAAKEQLGLNRPYLVQYGDWIWRIVRHGDFGYSYYSKRPVFHEILERLPPTIQLAAGTMVFSALISVTLGTIAAARQDSWLDYVFRSGT